MKTRLGLLALMVCAPALAADNPMDSVQKFERLPNSRGVVGFGEQTVLVTDNPRYVMKGQLWDMWSKMPVNNPRQLAEAESQLPLSDMQLDLGAAVSLIQGEPTLTVFLDPASPSFSSDVTRLGELDHWQLVLVPLSGQSVTALNQATCALDKRAALASLTALGKAPPCQSPKVARSAALAAFLHLKRSPTLVDAHGHRYDGWPEWENRTDKE